MKECWIVDVEIRPRFANLRAKFEEIISIEDAEHYAKLDEPYHQFNEDNAHFLEV